MAKIKEDPYPGLNHMSDARFIFSSLREVNPCFFVFLPSTSTFFSIHVDEVESGYIGVTLVSHLAGKPGLVHQHNYL